MKYKIPRPSDDRRRCVRSGCTPIASPRRHSQERLSTDDEATSVHSIAGHRLFDLACCDLWNRIMGLSIEQSTSGADQCCLAAGERTASPTARNHSPPPTILRLPNQIEGHIAATWENSELGSIPVTWDIASFPVSVSDEWPLYLVTTADHHRYWRITQITRPTGNSVFGASEGQSMY